jgi:hypothetical protein
MTIPTGLDHIGAGGVDHNGIFPVAPWSRAPFIMAAVAVLLVPTAITAAEISSP